MGMPASDIQDITVPQEDGAIQEALADLDRKLAVHAAAVRDVQALLLDLAKQANLSVSTPPETQVPEDTPPAASETKRLPPQRLKDTATVAPVEATEPVESAADVPQVTAPAEPADETPTPADPAHAATSDAPGEKPTGLSEDDALLASLDEATSKAIRVLRRLNPDRSVRELLKQVEKQRDAANSAPKPAAKSWFRRR